MAKFVYKVPPNELKKTVTQRLYLDEQRILWGFYMDSFTGGDSYRKSGHLNLLPHEKDKDLISLKYNITPYDNHCKRIINNYLYQLNSDFIIREGIDSLIEILEFKDYDNRNLSIDEFFRKIEQYTLILGEIYVLIVKPEINYEDVNNGLSTGTEFILSNAEAKALDFKYIAQLILPNYVYSLEYDNYLNIIGVTIEAIDRYVYITPSEIKEFNIVGINQVDVKTRPNTFGFVPLIRCAIDVNQDGYGDGLLVDIADLNRAVYNIDAVQLFDMFVNSQSIMMFQLDDKLASLYSEWGWVKDGKLELEGKKYIPTPPGSEPKYLVKPLDYHDKLNILRSRFSEAIDKISNQRLMELQSQSGVSKAYDEDNKNQGLENLSYIFESFEYAFWDLGIICLQSTLTIEQIQITYKHRFDVIDKNTKLDNLIKTKLSVDNMEVTKTIDKIITKDQLMYSVSDEELENLLEIIDKTETIQEVKAIEEALNNNDNQLPIPENPINQDLNNEGTQ